MGRSSEEEGRGESEDGGGGGGEVGEPDPTLPCTEDVILKTEQVTKNIQELLRAAQEFKHDRLVKDTHIIESHGKDFAAAVEKNTAINILANKCNLIILIG